MSFQVGDKVVWVYHNDGGIPNLKAGMTGVIVRLDSCSQGIMSGVINWGSGVQLQSFMYLFVWLENKPKDEPKKPEPTGYVPPVKRMPTFTGKITNDYM